MNYQSSAVRRVITVDDLLLDTIEQPTFFASTDHARLQQLPAHILPGKWKDIALHDHAASPVLHTLSYDAAEAMTLSVWHHGASYHAVLCGRPEAIIEYSDYSDSERESYSLAVMKQYVAAREVLSIATLATRDPLKSWHDVHTTKQSWEIIGSMAAARTPRGTTPPATDDQSPVTVIGTADPRYIAAVCRKIGLHSTAQTPIDASTVVGLDDTIIAGATVIGNITPQTRHTIDVALTRSGADISLSTATLLGRS